MMIQTMRTKIDWSGVRFWIFVIVTIGFFVWRTTYNRNNQILYKDVACPSLFSITRSAHDTLIVMKNVDVCNDYMMENLK